MRPEITGMHDSKALFENINEFQKDFEIEINPETIKKIESGSQEVFKTCRVDSELGTAFYASNPEKRYPWIYTRDFSAMITGLSELGDWETAKKCCNFLLNTQGEDGQWQQKYDKEGIIKNIENTKPVVQEDNTPLAVWAILNYAKESKDREFQESVKPKIAKALDWAQNHHVSHIEKTGLVHSTTSIHQTATYNQGYELWHNSLAAKVFLLFGEIYNDEKSLEIAKSLKDNIGKDLVKDNRFIRKLDDNLNQDFTPDIITTAPAYFDIFEQNEEIREGLSYKEVMANTLSFMEKELRDPEMGGFWRYPNYVYQELHPEYKGEMTDPLVPGPYFIASSMAARAYNSIGDKRKLQETVEWMVGHNKDGQFSEHLTTRKRFEKYKEREISYMSERKKDPVYLKGVQSNFKAMEEEAKGQQILNYSLPLCWSQIEVLRLLKLTGTINKFKIKA